MGRKIVLIINDIFLVFAYRLSGFGPEFETLIAADNRADFKIRLIIQFMCGGNLPSTPSPFDLHRTRT
jgi:hypothetical protein